jgi:MFS family permease
LKAQLVGVPIALIPVVYLLFNLVYALCAVPAGMAADKFGKRRIILIGYVLFALLYSGFGWAKSPLSIWILFSLYGVFMALTEGIQKAFLATIIPPEFKATAFGIYAMSVGVAMLPASLIGGWLWDHVSPAATFYFGSATALLAALLFSIFVLSRKSTIIKSA